jgi:hypothetical protein
MKRWLSVQIYRYSDVADKFIASGSATLAGHLHMCYYHKSVPNLQFGVEWESNYRMQESVATFAYQTELPDEGVTLRGLLID